MISISRTTDYALVKTIATNPYVYEKSSDDYAPHPSRYQPVEHPEMIYLTVSMDDVVCGLFALIPHSHIMYEVHTCLLPEILGSGPKRAFKPSIEASKLMLEWLWKNTKCQRLITAVPESNKIALRYAKNAGMQAYGCNHRSFMKYGVLEGLWMLGMNRPEVAPEVKGEGVDKFR